eukprot:1152423-Pelagomonas_calceolata.AAC.1
MPACGLRWAKQHMHMRFKISWCASGRGTHRLLHPSRSRVGSDGQCNTREYGQCNTCECASRYNGAPVAVERIAPCTHCASVWAQMGNATLMNVLQAKDEPTCSTLLASTEYAGLALSIHEREKGRTCSTPPGPTEAPPNAWGGGVNAAGAGRICGASRGAAHGAGCGQESV